MKLVEDFLTISPKGLVLVVQTVFVYIAEDFAINYIRPKFLSLLLTVKIRIGVAEKGSLKKYS